VGGQRWDMGTDTLGTLAKKTGTLTTDLGGLVKQLANAAQPLEGKLSGEGKEAFSAFKARVDGIATDLNAGLAAIAKGQQGMDAAVRTGQSEMASAAKKKESAANFDAAKFGNR
jgi:hypothetical protein